MAKMSMQRPSRPTPLFLTLAVLFKSSGSCGAFTSPIIPPSFHTGYFHSTSGASTAAPGCRSCDTTLFSRKPARKQKKRVQEDAPNHAKDWQGCFNSAQAFISSHGHCNPEEVGETDPELAAWLMDQSEQIRWHELGLTKKARITKKRADAMMRAGMFVEAEEEEDDWMKEVEKGKNWVAEQDSEERGKIGRQRLKTTYEQKQK